MHTLLKSSVINFYELQIRPAVRKALNKAKMEVFLGVMQW